MKWQVNYALKYLQEGRGEESAQHLREEAIRISIPERPDAIAVISADYLVSTEAAKKYHSDYPEMDFLCGYRKECIWEGGAIEYLESNGIGWGSAGTLGSAVSDGMKTAEHKDYAFSYRLIKQMRSIARLERNFDRVFTMTLANGRSLRVGMIKEYEPTADAIRTFCGRFGPIDIAWNINPNGYPTSNAVEAGRSLGCEVMKWEELREILKAK